LNVVSAAQVLKKGVGLLQWNFAASVSSPTCCAVDGAAAVEGMGGACAEFSIRIACID
jgi:hypothetical protein